MKNKTFATTLVAVLLAAHMESLSLHAQGALTPPGAPAPTMKSLDQIEARTPLVAGQRGVTVFASGAITITNDGSYYLTGNLVINTAGATGINLGSQSATIDLNGYSIIMTNNASTAFGITAVGSSTQQIRIRNGRIEGGGITALLGISVGGGMVDVEDVQCYNVNRGIILTLTSATSVKNCAVSFAGGIVAQSGIVASDVSGCSVNNTIGAAIVGNRVSGCVVRQENATYSGNGISALGGLVSDCYVFVNASATAIIASVANGCVIAGGASTITSKYNMP